MPASLRTATYPRPASVKPSVTRARPDSSHSRTPLVLSAAKRGRAIGSDSTRAPPSFATPRAACSFPSLFSLTDPAKPVLPDTELRCQAAVHGERLQHPAACRPLLDPEDDLATVVHDFERRRHARHARGRARRTGAGPAAPAGARSAAAGAASCLGRLAGLVVLREFAFIFEGFHARLEVADALLELDDARIGLRLRRRRHLHLGRHHAQTRLRRQR